MKWEYIQIKSLKYKINDKGLNHYGEQGWELIDVDMLMTEDNQIERVYMFKREKVEKKPLGMVKGEYVYDDSPQAGDFLSQMRRQMLDDIDGGEKGE